MRRACGTTDPPPSMTCTLGRDHRGGHRIRVPGQRPADGHVRRAAVLNGPGLADAGAHAVRFREDNPQELARARAAVAAWRGQNPAGTAEQLVAALGRPVPPGLRSRAARGAVRGRPAPGPGRHRDHHRRCGSRPVSGYAGPVRPARREVADEPDQVSAAAAVPRSAPGRDHRDRRVRNVAGPHPEENGETVTSRYTLRELLDRLDELTRQHHRQPDDDPG